jgi:hypothetical protein
MHNIGLIGKARSGKDTAAGFLVRDRAYVRLAFADPLKEMALRIDPWIPSGYGVYVRLSKLIRDVGWDYAKETYPEVRRILQHTGQTVREYDDEFWLTAIRRKLNTAERWNIPVVVTDVRYPNEARMLKARGFRLVRVVRPGASAGGNAAQHSSETALDDFQADVTVTNAGTLEELRTAVAAL